MSEPENSVISSKKVISGAASYIWNSPCLKPLIYNPFILSALILLIIWLMDLFYEKKFSCGSPAVLAQHMLTTYAIVVSGVILNNVLIKHNYREKTEKIGAGVPLPPPPLPEPPMEAAPQIISYTTQYVEQPEEAADI